MLSRIPIALSALLFAMPVLAQESRGAILGRITDSSGAVAPGVAVRVTNVETGVAVPASSNDQGNYFAPFLIPGMYRITAEKAGFKTVVRDGIRVNVNDRLEVNLTLEVGPSAETITVGAEAPLLDTVGASLGQVVDSRRVAELPINHGNPYLLIRIAGGVNFTRNFKQDNPWEPLGNTGYAMAGSRSSRAEFTLDGASNTTTDQAAYLVTPAYTPPADAVAEFKVQTAVFDATTGQTEGGVVNLGLKSGTNAIHGSAYWAKQDPSMNANLWFANRSGQPRNDLQYNRWGGTFSGPVTIPRLYNGKNRTFFMFAYEGIHQTSPVGLVATVPTAAQRNGDFSALLRLGANYQIYDPFTRTAAANGRYTNQPVPGNIIPASRISPSAQKIFSYYPLPSEAGTADGGNNLPRPSWPGRITYHTHLYKFDHQFNEKNRLSFRFNFFGRRSVDNDQFGFDNPALGAIFWQESRGFSIDDVHVFSPSLVMNVRLSDSAFVRAQDTTLPGRDFDLTSLGLPAAVRDAIDPAYRRFPSIVVAGYTSLGARPPLYKPTETRILAGSLNKVKGSHGMKFGGEFRDYYENQYAGSATTALQMTFGANYTVGPFDNSPAGPRGQGLASLLYGVPTAGILTLPADYAQRSTVWAGFFQDDWKVTRKLTLTLGLRYELEGPLTERFNRSVRGFDAGAVLPIEAQARANYAKAPTPEIPAAQFVTRGGLTFAGVNGQPRTLFARDTNNFMPRIGAAWSAGAKTVVRAGYGVYFGALGARRGDVIQTGFSQDNTVVESLDGGVTFAAGLSNPFPNGILRPQGAAAGPMTNAGNAISFFNPHPAASRTQKWQAGFQRSLPGNWVLDAHYQGSRGRNLDVTRSLTAFPNQYLSTSPVRDQTAINYLSTNLPNPFEQLLPGTGRAGSVIGRAALLAPNPHFTNITFASSEGDSWYNSLNVKAEKRFSHGHTVQASYTWSKFLEATALLNPGDAAPARVISDEDFPHHVALSWVWEMPFGRGRRLASGANRLVDGVIGGWQMSGIWTYQSGPALGFGDAILLGDLHDVPLSSSERSVDRWFDTSVFERNSARQLARHLRTMSLRFNGIRGNAYNFWDFSMMKNIRVTEGVKVELRGEALNLMNHVAFDNPDVNPVSTNFGRVTAEKGMPRRIQLTLRVKF